jgi:hypothetical protein
MFPMAESGLSVKINFPYLASRYGNMKPYLHAAVPRHMDSSTACLKSWEYMVFLCNLFEILPTKIE